MKVVRCLGSLSRVVALIHTCSVTGEPLFFCPIMETAGCGPPWSGISIDDPGLASNRRVRHSLFHVRLSSVSSLLSFLDLLPPQNVLSTQIVGISHLFDVSNFGITRVSATALSLRQLR